MKYYDEILKKLLHDLESLENKKVHDLVKAEEGITITKETLEVLRNLVIKEGFNNATSEIYFFKNIKPQVVSKLIYYVKRLNIESKRPKESKKDQVKYLKGYIRRLQTYFNNNLEFYHYYKRNANHLDRQYFLRDNCTIRLNIEAYHFYTDRQFSTSHGITVATIIAYTNLIEYLKKEIYKLENNNEEINVIHSMNSKLNWTNSKTDLVELIYALYSSGAINSGTADIKDVAMACQQIFNIDLGNYYHSFVEMRLRKINATKFMDKLKESLIQYMNNLDDINRK